MGNPAVAERLALGQRYGLRVGAVAITEGDRTSGTAPHRFHKTANVLAALPKSAHPGAKKALAEIWGAEDKDHALAAVKAFDAAYGAKSPKAAAKIVRHRTKVTTGPGSRAAVLAMAFKLIESTQDRWRAVKAPHLVAPVPAGARFERGKLVERAQQEAA